MKEETPTQSHDSVFSTIPEMIRKGIPNDIILDIIDDLDRYYSNGLLGPFATHVKKGLRTRLEKLEEYRQQILKEAEREANIISIRLVESGKK